MKAKELNFRLKANLLTKINCQYFKNGHEKSFTTYLWSKVDVYYCERLQYYMRPRTLFRNKPDWQENADTPER